MKKSTLLIAIVFLASCAGMKKDKKEETSNAAMSEQQMQEAQAEIQSKKKVSGNVDFKTTEKGILVTADVKGLKPNSVHGFHIHENGKCEAPDYKSAGGHFNPHGTDHAGPGAPKKHVGDLGNLVADAKGNAKKKILLSNEEVKQLDMISGKALIIHANADDLVSNPSGNAGDRIACGIIEQKSM